MEVIKLLLLNKKFSVVSHPKQTVKCVFLFPDLLAYASLF